MNSFKNLLKVVCVSQCRSTGTTRSRRDPTTVAPSARTSGLEPRYPPSPATRRKTPNWCCFRRCAGEDLAWLKAAAYRATQGAQRRSRRSHPNALGGVRASWRFRPATLSRHPLLPLASVRFEGADFAESDGNMMAIRADPMRQSRIPNPPARVPGSASGALAWSLEPATHRSSGLSTPLALRLSTCV